jgi:hypothetical protein
MPWRCRCGGGWRRARRGPSWRDPSGGLVSRRTTPEPPRLPGSNWAALAATVADPGVYHFPQKPIHSSNRACKRFNAQLLQLLSRFASVSRAG